MVIALAGYSGFIGKQVQNEFREHELIRLGRNDLYGSPLTLAKKIRSADVLLNTAGSSISRRWTKKNRKKIMESRISVTENLVEAIRLCDNRPAVFINASAIGIYEQGKIHDETNFSTGIDFLAEVVKQWEESAGKANDMTRIVLIRLGMVLGKQGGAFPRLYKIFRLGLGGVIGSGKQIVSFVHVEDVIGTIRFLIEKNLHGAFNVTAPNPVANKEFTKSLAHNAHRPAFFRIPAWMMKILMGRAASIIVKGQTVYPKRLQEAGYKFNFATIEETFEDIVNQS